MKKEKIFLITILISAFLLRFVYLSQPNFFFDESIGAEEVENVKQGIPISFTKSHALDYLKVFPYIFKVNEFTMRIYSVITGTLLVLLVYFLGKNLYNKKCGIVAALLLAVCPLHVIYSRFTFLDIPQSLFLIGAILLAEKSFENWISMVFSAILFSFAFIIKPNSIIIWAIYWGFIIYERRSLYHFIILNSVSLLSVILIVALIEGNLIYFAYGVFNRMFGGGLGSTYPFYYYFVVLLALSPIIYLVALIAICKKKVNRSDKLIAFIILAYIFVISFIQTWRFPRYLVLIAPFIMILVARFAISLKKITKYVVILLILSGLIWTSYYIIKFNKYTVWTDVDDYIKFNYPQSKISIDIYASYPFMFYNKGNIIASINPSDLNMGDLVILTRLFSNSTLSYSPFENDYFTFLKCKRCIRNRDYYLDYYVPYVKDNGILLETFKNFDTDAVWIYEITDAENVTNAPPLWVQKDGFIKEKMWNFICNKKLFSNKEGVQEKCIYRIF